MKFSTRARIFAFLSSAIQKQMMRTLSIWAIVIVLFTGYSYADAVSDWNATAVTVTLRITNPARSVLVDLAYLHIAIYDAVNSIDKRYTVFAISPPNAVPWASKEAAIHGAAHKILRTFYIADSLYIDSVYQARIALLPADSTTTRGLEIGHTTAEMFLAFRTGDGREANLPYVWQPAGTGVYQPTPPGSAPYQPVAHWQRYLRPFSFSSPSKFRAPGPPSFNSNRYTTVLNEVKKYGSLDSTYTTPEQREIARFHTENPAVQVSRNIRLFAASQNLSLADNVRLFATLYTSIGDALISGWDSKYYYNYWRPVTAIRGAGSDGNPATDEDTSWLPLVATPRHPEYPAAHGCVLGSFSYAIEKFFGTPDVEVTLTSNVTGVLHHFNNINEIVTEAINARVYGGMHFRSSAEDGVEIGKKVAEWVAENKFQLYVPVNELIYVLPLNNGIKNALASKLQLAIKAYSEGRYNASENLLNALLNQVGQLISNSTITQQQAQPLIDYISDYLDLIASVLPKITDTEVPGNFILYQNYPNPFNPVTKIRYDLPVVSRVSCSVYDVLGTKVQDLEDNELKQPGTYELSFDASGLPSGVYFFRISANDFVSSRKMILLK